MTFSAGRQVLVEMARSFGVLPSRFTGGDRLDDASYAQLEAALLAGGLGWRNGADTRDTLAALRSTYEPLLDALSRHLHTPVPHWLPQDSENDNWEQGPRGLLAGWLVEELATQHGKAPAMGNGSVAQRIRRRLHRNEPQDP